MSTVLDKKSFQPSVSSHGYSDSSIFFLLGHPTKDDIANGMALSGYSESTLSTFLREPKISLKQCYRSTFIKEPLEYAGTNPKKLAHALNKIDLNLYLDLLFEELKDVNPNVVVPLDDIALSAVFPHINQIKKPKGRMYWVYCYRGSVLPLRADFQGRLPNTIRVIPTLSPQILNQDWVARSFVQIDFNRIKENSLKRSVIEEYGKIWIARSYEQVVNFFERGLSKNPTFVTFDIETYGGLLTCISFCFDGYEAASIPMSPFYYPEISKGELALMWKCVSKMLASKLPKCNQNIKYDWQILQRHGFIVNNVLHDTMLKGALLYPELPKGLDFYTSIYTPIPYYKDEGKEYNPQKDSKDKLLLYNAKDSLAAHIVNEKEDLELEESGTKELYYKEVAPLILIYKDIDETGIFVDDEQKQRLIAKYTQFYVSNTAILRGFINNEGFNPKSPQQVGKLLYEGLKFPKRMKTNEQGIKTYNTGKETLDDLLINFGEMNALGKLGYQVISRIIVCRKLAKVLEYLNTPLFLDGTFRGASNLAGTETGRSSFSKTIDESFYTEEELIERRKNKKPFKLMKRLGRSLQTITKHGFEIDDEIFDDWESTSIAHDIRSIFVPPRDFVFIEGDGSGAEARVVFVLAEDYEGLASMDQKPKIHAKTAALCFGLDVNLIKKDEFGNWTPSIPKIGMTYYDGGKRIRHAGNYDMTEFRLSQMTHLPLVDSRLALNRFHDGNPKIRGIFHADVDKVLKETRELVTPFGRKRIFLDRFTNHIFKEAKAQIPQSTISDLTKFTMPRLKENLDGYKVKYHFLNEAHDGILAAVHKNYKMEYAKAFKLYYERPIDFRKGSLQRDFELIVPAEISMSDTNWMSMTEIHI